MGKRGSERTYSMLAPLLPKPPFRAASSQHRPLALPGLSFPSPPIFLLAFNGATLQVIGLLVSSGRANRDGKTRWVWISGGWLTWSDTSWISLPFFIGRGAAGRPGDYYQFRSSGISCGWLSSIGGPLASFLPLVPLMQPWTTQGSPWPATFHQQTCLLLFYPWQKYFSTAPSKPWGPFFGGEGVRVRVRERERLQGLLPLIRLLCVSRRAMT